MENSIEHIFSGVENFNTISLQDLDQVKLLNRVDEKYLLSNVQALEVISLLSDDYLVLKIDNKRCFRYNTLYFDTDHFNLYKLHHNEVPRRVKVRFREYTDTGLCFFEAKYKLGNGRTDKKRIQQDKIPLNLQENHRGIIKQKFFAQAELLNPKMKIFFDRVTLVSKKMNERLTIDFNLSFHNFKTDYILNDFSVVEVKSDKSSADSPVKKVLKEKKVFSESFSKYSISVAMMEDVKKNNFKPTLRRLYKIQTYGKRDIRSY